MIQDVWHFTLLGGWQIRQGEKTLERFRTHKTATLLAYLAYHLQRTHHREELAELLWPETTPELGLKSLGVALSSLRKILEPPGVPAGSVIMADRLTIRLNPDAVKTDVRSFESALTEAKRAASAPDRRRAWEAALDVYRGDLLPGFYEDWVLRERERLILAYTGALDTLIAILGESDEPAVVIPYLLRRVQADPYNEAACRHLMRAYIAIGQPDAAREHYESLVKRLRQEMGIEPEEETQAVMTGIRPLRVTPRTVARIPNVDSTPEGSALEGAPARVRLPLPLTRFFGRETELERILTWLADGSCRLLTLTGPGGSGKTRLSIEAAQRFSAHCNGRIVFVPLADLTSPSLVIGAIRSALQLPEQRGSTPQPQDAGTQQVVAALSSTGSTLLLLDNLEHLLATPSHPNNEDLPRSLPSLVSLLLEQVPTLQLLTTSRQPLGLLGEQEFAVTPLPTPHNPAPLDTPAGVSGLLEFACVQLLVDRARLKQPDFQVTPRNAEAIVGLCTKLDGIPLAIELAAGWLRVLPPAALLTQLEAGFSTLVSRQKNVPERHQTLYAAIEWSYRFLAPELQRFLNSLAVFRGGWTMEAAEAVCDEHRAREYLGELVERSLVVPERESGTEGAETIPRYRLLETLRDFVAGRLAESGQAETVQKRHLTFFRNLVEVAEASLTGPEQAVWLDRLEREHDNLRAALQGSGDEVALRLAGVLWRFWLVRGHLSEGRARLASVLARCRIGDGTREWTALRARVLHGAGGLAWSQGDYVSARQLQNEALSLRRELGDRRDIAASLNNLALTNFDQGDHSAARLLYEESLALYRELGDPRGISTLLNNLGLVARGQGDYREARRLYEESLSLRRESGDSQGIAQSLNHLGNIAWSQGDYGAAQTLHAESLSLRQALGDKRGITDSLSSLGNVAYDQGDYVSARQLQNEALSLRRELGDKKGIAFSLANLGAVAHFLGEYAEAQTMLEAALVLYQELRDKSGIAFSLHNLGNVACDQGNHPVARTLQKEGLTLYRELGDKRGIAYSLESFAALAGDTGDSERAARLWGVTRSLRESIGVSLPPSERARYEERVTNVRSALGEEAFATIWSEGKTLTLEAAVAYALHEPTAHRP